MALTLRHILVFFLTFNAVACMQEPEDRRTENDASENVEDSASLTKKPVSRDFRHVFIACFYGAHDHGEALEKCNEMLRDCRQAYGKEMCHVLRNPTEKKVAAIPEDAVTIVVTHSTPIKSSPDVVANLDCSIDIWDSTVSPQDFNRCGGPVVWYGCYGATVADECKNIVPLQDKPTMLNSNDPKVACRFRATMICIDRLKQKGKLTAQEIRACAVKVEAELKKSGEPACKATKPKLR